MAKQEAEYSRDQKVVDKKSPKKGGKGKDAFSQMIDDKSDDPKESAVKRTEDAGTWKTRYNLAYRNQKNMFKKFAEWYELMYAIKTYKNISIWKSQAFIPVMSYKAWTIIAKLIGLRPGFSVKIFDEIYSDEDRKLIDKANIKLEFDYDNPNLEETIRDKQFDTLTDAVVTGTGFGKAEWVSGTRKMYSHFKRDDGTIDYSKAECIEADYGYNDLEPLNVFDVFGAPGKRSWERKAWIIIKYRKTASELLSSDLYDEAVVSKLKPLGKNRDVVTKYKQSRNQFIGETQDDQESLDETVDSFDVFECYEKTPDGIFLMTFAEASAETELQEAQQAEQRSGKKNTDSDDASDGVWYEIRNERQPYWHNKYPIVPAYIRRRPHDCWGESIFEVTESMANAYNDIFNQLADNLAIVGNGGILMHETSTTIYDFYYAPGGEVRYSGTKPEFETPKTPDMALFDRMFNLLDAGITNATVSPYATGTPNDQNDQTQGTAAGINALQEAAGEITAFMKGSYMQFVKGVGIRWLSNNRQFFDEALVVKKKTAGKNQVLRITSDDFLDTMVLDIDEDSMQPTTKQQQREETGAWLTSLTTVQDRSLMQAGLVANPAVPTQPGAQPAQPPQGVAKPIYFDWQKIAREVSEDYHKPDIDEFILDTDNPAANVETSNAELVAAMRELVRSGELEPEEAQQIIDAIEGRSGAEAAAAATDAATQLISSTEGGENGTTEETAEEPTTAAAGRSGATPSPANVAA